MAGLGRLGVADGGSSYDSMDRDKLDFPGVPFTSEHFTPKAMCPSGDGKYWSIYKFNLLVNAKQIRPFIERLIKHRKRQQLRWPE